MSDFNKYQEFTATTAIYPQAVGRYYTVLGLCGEAGEVAEKVKKFLRDGGDSAAVAADIRKELGDVLWYVSEAARQWGFDLQDVADTNVRKLTSRKERDVLSGSGDNR